MSKCIEQAMTDLHANVSFGGGGRNGGGGGGGSGTFGRPNATSRYTGNTCTVRGVSRSAHEGAAVGGIVGTLGGAARGAVAGAARGAVGGLKGAAVGAVVGGAMGAVGGAATNGGMHTAGCRAGV